MGTTATIVVKIDDTVHSIYVNFDGHTLLPILTKYYTSEDKIKKLIALGDLSVLGKSVNCPVGHTWNNSADGCCVSYRRDRKELGTDAKTHNSIASALKESDSDHKYVYAADTGWIKFGESK